MKDGIYKNSTATYFVKDGKVLMMLNGSLFKTNENFMMGASFQGPLKEGMINQFDEAYNTVKSW